MRNLAAVLILCLSTPALAQTRPAAKPETVAGFDLARLALVEPVINAAITEKKTPGVVLLVGRHDRIIYQKAFGNRALSPATEPMTVDTIFDLASLTKVVATTTAVMQLLEEGKVRLSDRVATFIPEFGKYGKDGITVLHLMTHVSGLRPDLDLAEEWRGYDTAITLACEEVPTSAPGERFVYSDINYELLGEIVHRVSGKTLDAYVREHIFDPLGMKDTQFRPPSSLRPRIAPTELCTAFGWPCQGQDMQMLRGIVHDHTARHMDGVEGHAGLFSTAADLAVFCRMLLAGGAANGARVLSPLTLNRMLSPSTPPSLRAVRALGWDMDSSFSSNRGELLPPGSFGHTGFTGTSLWIDPATGVFVVFLSNRVHPDGKGDVTPLRARVATVVASALVDPGPLPSRYPQYWTLHPGAITTPPPPRPVTQPVLSGLDVGRAEGFPLLKGKRVGLVTNHTGIARDRQSTIDLINQAPGAKLVALFSPEHGIRGILDESVPTTKDERTGLPIFSLYGATNRLDDTMLRGIDAIVVDRQDIGARFYTYMTTIAYVLEEAAKRKLPVIVIDRPNPITGVQIEGPSLDGEALGFTGYFPAMPIRHGLTMGELATLFNGENKIGANLTVLKMKNWKRDAWFDETGIPWVNFSPNMRNLNEATLYPGIGAIEGTNISVGRGTDTPFEQLGAPWIDGVKLADALNGRHLPGIRFYPVRFPPTASKYANEECQGVFIIVTDRTALRPVRVGIEIASALRRLYGDKYDIDKALRLVGSKATLERVTAGEDPATIAASWAAGESRWRAMSAKYLLYRE